MPIVINDCKYCGSAPDIQNGAKGVLLCCSATDWDDCWTEACEFNELMHSEADFAIAFWNRINPEPPGISAKAAKKFYRENLAAFMESQLQVQA